MKMPQVDVVALARVHPVDDLFFPKKTILISHQLLRHVPAWYCHKVFGGDRCRYVNAWLPITSKFSASCCAPSTIHRPQLKTILLNASPCQIPSSSNILQQLLDPLSDTLVRPCISRRPPISYYPASTIFQKLQVLDRKKSQWRVSELNNCSSGNLCGLDGIKDDQTDCAASTEEVAALVIDNG